MVATLHADGRRCLWIICAKANRGDASAVEGKHYIIINIMENLNSEEREILLDAAENGGEIYLGKTQAGEIVEGTKQFGNWDDRRSRTKYIEALESLIGKKLIKHDEGILYCLTSKGYEINQELTLPNNLFKSKENTPQKYEPSPQSANIIMNFYGSVHGAAGTVQGDQNIQP